MKNKIKKLLICLFYVLMLNACDTNEDYRTVLNNRTNVINDTIVELQNDGVTIHFSNDISEETLQKVQKKLDIVVDDFGLIATAYQPILGIKQALDHYNENGKKGVVINVLYVVEQNKIRANGMLYNNEIYLLVDDPYESIDEFESVIHHELMHYFHYNDIIDIDTEAFQNINGIVSYGGFIPRYIIRYPCFATMYASSSFDEDLADTYATMMMGKRARNKYIKQKYAILEEATKTLKN